MQMAIRSRRGLAPRAMVYMRPVPSEAPVNAAALRASAPARAATPAVTPATRGPGAQEVRIVIDGLPEWPVVSVRQRRHPKRLCCEVARAWREADVNRKRRVHRMGYAGRLKEQAQQAGELSQVRLRDGPVRNIKADRPRTADPRQPSAG